MAIGVAIIGGGIFAREEHYPAVIASGDLTLKAVYSRSLKSAKSLGADEAQLDHYSDDSGDGKNYGDLLLRNDIKAVIIALPIIQQPEYIKLALSAGKHVLSEKPIADQLSSAQDLLRWYRSEIAPQKVSWSVAENFRFLNSFDYAASQVKSLGRILTFRVQVNNLVTGGKYFETAWRKTPEYQGGFILDGGVHTIAALRLLLGSDPVAQLSAFSSQRQEHLPPVDTVDAVLKTKSGATGTLSISFGTTLRANVYAIGCEKGSVQVSYSKVTTKIDGKEETKDVEDERSGVPTEVRKWARAFIEGHPLKEQLPEEALADLEILEKILRSGEANGVPQQCSLQTPAAS